MTAAASLQALRPCKLDSIVPFRACLAGRVSNSACSVFSATKRHRGHMKTLARCSKVKSLCDHEKLISLVHQSVLISSVLGGCPCMRQG